MLPHRHKTDDYRHGIAANLSQTRKPSKMTDDVSWGSPKPLPTRMPPTNLRLGESKGSFLGYLFLGVGFGDLVQMQHDGKREECKISPGTEREPGLPQPKTSLHPQSSHEAVKGSTGIPTVQEFRKFRVWGLGPSTEHGLKFRSSTLAILHHSP